MKATMNVIKTIAQHSFKIVDKSVYLALFCVGCVFIYQGDVLQRFQLKRTNFAEYEEDITELPTVQTWLGFGNLTFGQDYNISYKPHGTSQSILLSQGLNSIGTVKIKFQQFGRAFTLTPLNFSRGMPRDYDLTFEFKNASWKNVVKDVGISLSSENNTMECNGIYWDGEVSDDKISIGQDFLMHITPEKFVYIKDAYGCRERPYHQELHEYILKNILKECKTPCWQNLPECVGEHEDLPMCEDKEEKQCFKDVMDRALHATQKKPCTKLQYRVGKTSIFENPGEESLATFRMRVGPKVGNFIF